MSGGADRSDLGAHRRTFGQVERRWSGLVILAAVMFAVAVAPAIGGRAVGGRAVIGSIPGPPRVGDCLLQRPAGPETVDKTGAPLYGTLTTAPCAGRRFGDVVAVIAGGLSTGPVEVADDDGVISYDDPNRHLCSAALAGYLHGARPAGAWSPAIAFSTVIGGPSGLQRRTGQSWVVCVAQAEGSDGKATPYVGALSTSDSADLLPARVAGAATCLSSTDFFLQRPLDCRQPHPVESMAMLLTDHPSTTLAGLRARCRELARSYTQMSDPTAGGRLIDAVVAVHRASDGTQAPGLVTGDETGFARCVVQTNGSRQLIGSLLGLRDRPVPFAR
jgi:hypothetical protein